MTDNQIIHDGKSYSLYRPSNGSMGDMIYSQLCAGCRHEDHQREKYCDCLGTMYAFDIDQLDEKEREQWGYIRDNDGNISCRFFQDKTVKSSPIQPRCTQTLDLFGGDA